MASVHRTIIRAYARRQPKREAEPRKEKQNKMLRKFKIFLLKTLFKNDEIVMNVKIDSKTGVTFTDYNYLMCFRCTFSNFNEHPLKLIKNMNRRNK